MVTTPFLLVTLLALPAAGCNDAAAAYTDVALHVNNQFWSSEDMAYTTKTTEFNTYLSELYRGQ